MEQLDPYFIEEATEMLQVIEEKLVMLLEEKTTDRVHTLLRSAHTLKGSAASMGLNTIHTIAHHLEDVFEALYPSELEIDPELGSLLLDGYECLRTPLSAILSGNTYDEDAILNKTASVFALLQDKLGDFFGREAPMPSSEELGFDVVGSIFKKSVSQDLQILEEAIASNDPTQIANVLRSQGNFFLNIGASYQLPGLEEIAKSILAALERHPQEILEIGVLAYENLEESRAAVLAGDRTRGGEVSSKLCFLAGNLSSVRPAAIEAKPEIEAIPTENVDNSLSVVVEETLEPEEPAAAAESNTLTTTSEPTQEATIISSTIIPSPALEESFSAKSPVDRFLYSLDLGDPQTSLRSKDDYFANLPSNKALQEPELDRLSPQPSSASIKVAIDRLDRLTQTMGELLIEENQQKVEVEKIYQVARETLRQFSTCQRQLRKIDEWCDRHLLLSESRQQLQPKSLTHLNGSSRRKINTFNGIGVNGINLQFDTLEMDAYSDLHLLVSQMSENMSALGEKVETIERAISNSFLAVNKRRQLIDGARENLLESRMVALGILLNRFPRLLKQMVKPNVKQAELKLIGTEVLIDKAICDRLYEPLLHLIRNAYDHGIEPIEVRQKSGKPEIGTITIHAYHQGNRTTIEVKDDGRGLNWDKIRAKAIEQKIIDPNLVESSSVSELAEVLFEPGFSTAPKVSELSGRGIGLDVVRTQLQELDGSISIRSLSGEGTNFTLQLPLKLTTASLLICQSRGIIYALLARSIDRIILPEPDQICQQHGLAGQNSQNFLIWQQEEEERLVPIFALSDLIDYQCDLYYQADDSPLFNSIQNKQDRAKPLLILGSDRELISLQVEQILSEQELVIKTLGPTPAFPSYVQGYSILGNGNLTLTIDPTELINQVDFKLVVPKMTSLQATLSTLEPEPSEQLALQAAPIRDASRDNFSLANRDLTVLVVEDSAFQRRNVVSIISEAGYQVLQAGNGSDGFSILEENPKINLIVCDIEMPLMNGFEFLDRCRLDPRFANIPVVMLTSRSSSKHRKAALTLGAKGYHTKPCTSVELLETIDLLLNRK